MERLSGLISVDREMPSKLKKVISSSANVGDLKHIYTTIGGQSSKFDEFLAARSQFDGDHGVDFSTPTSCQSATFVRPLFAFYCTLFFTKNNNKLCAISSPTR